MAPYADAYGVTYAEAAALVADGKREELITRIVERYREVERRCAAVVVIGSDFADGHHDDGHDELPRELAFNARLATEFGSVVVPVVSGRAPRPESLGAGGAQRVPLACRSGRDRARGDRQPGARRSRAADRAAGAGLGDARRCRRWPRRRSPRWPPRWTPPW